MLGTQKYEFHVSQHSTVQKVASSYVYMLFDLQNAPISQLTDFMTNPSSVEGMQASLDDFRIQMSLGSEFESISNFTSSGYTVAYKNGDVCNFEKEIMFSSSIDYVCDPSIEVGKPILSDFAGSTGSMNSQEECHYRFTWHSKQVCPQCKQAVINTVQGPCIDGYKRVQQMPKEGEHCVLYPELQNRNDGYPAIADRSGLNQSEVYAYKMDDQIEECSETKELMDNQIFISVMQKVLIFIFFLVICCIGSACGYMQLSRKFDKLERRHTQHQHWLALATDPERGPKLRTIFNQKMKDVKKAKKAVQKYTKSGSQGIKQAVQKGMKKITEKKTKVEMEEFEVEIGEI